MGFYLNPPSRRMAYDGDGTICFYFSTSDNIVHEFSEDNQRLMNGEANTSILDFGQFSPTKYLGFVFPEFRDITHMYVNSTAGNYVGAFSSRWEYSVDTTNGVDGNWTASSSFTCPVETTNPNYRDVNVYPMPNVKAVRMLCPGAPVLVDRNVSNVHLYGYKHAGETPHRIDFCDSAGVELLIDTDYGDQARNTERVWNTINTWNQSSGLYLKNRSTSKLATDISLSFENLTGTMIEDLALSEDQIIWSSSISILELQPGEIYGPIYVKHSLEVDDQVGVRASRLKLDVEDWS